MLHYYAILLLINWSCVRTEDVQITPIPDQLAVASNIGQVLKKPTNILAKSNFAKFNEHDDTPHYDNSNVFRPIVVPDIQYENTLQNDSHYNANGFSKSADFLEDDPVYSTEARILFNLPGPNLLRRSFDGDSQYNEFELLKVNNNTPAVANYHEFYEDSYAVNEEPDIPEYNRKKIRYRNNREPNYNVNSYSNNKYYGYSDGKNKNRKTPEKVQMKIKQDESNYPIQKERQEQKKKIFQPVVVIEPSNYKVDLKYGSQSVTTKLASSTSENPAVRDSVKSESVNHYNKMYQNVYSNNNNNMRASTSRHYSGAEDSKDVSDDSMDYSEVTERSRKIPKYRRRPYDSETSKRLPKEHRETYDESYDTEDSRKRYNPSRPRQRHRHRNKHNWSDDDRYSIEHVDEDNTKMNRDQYENKGNNNWNQPDPNGSIVQSNGYGVNQIERPKLLPLVPVNIVPVGNFDHATALGNSQGFDMSNVMLQNIGSTANIVSTAAPLISTSQSIVKTKGTNGFDLVNTVPDIIVGQSTIENPVQTIYISQPKQNTKTQFLQSTVTPIYAVSTTASPTQQGQSTTASRPIFAASTTVAPLQHLAIQTGVPMNQLLVSQPTLHTLTNIGQSVGNSNLQGNALKTSNLYQLTPKTKNYVQNAQIVPSMLHTGVNFNVQNNQNQNSYNPFTSSKSKENAQILKATNEAFESSMRQLQQQIMKNQGLSGTNFQSDTVGSTSNTNANVVNVIPSINFEKAQLPTLGTKNVEILNPNLKQNTLGLTLTNPLGVINQYPAAVLTTPIPILSTTNFATVKPVISNSGVDSIGLNTYVDTLTELGSKINSGSSQTLYNPIHFVPNLDLLKSQTILNSKGNHNDPLQQGLNLVPSIPGGNFFKNNNDLVTKPKLSSDLEKYAEEMLKESLRTIYNTHKWNNDRKFPRNISLIDSSPAAKLKNELLRYKGKDSGRDILEGHHTENKYHVIDSRPGNKRPDFSMAKLEELLMNDFKLHPPISNEPIHVYHHHGPRPGSYGRPSDQGSSYSNTESKHVRHEINDYLTPPKPNSFISKSPFHDKPIKKRPGRYSNHENHRPSTRTASSSKSREGPEASASNVYEYNSPYDSFTGSHYDRHHGYSEYRKRPHYDHFYPSLTTPYTDSSGERKGRDIFDMNHPRTHNLLGLLMKNNKLPTGASQSYNRDYEELESLLNDETRQRKQLNHLDLSVFQKKFDVHPNLTISNVKRLRTRKYNTA